MFDFRAPGQFLGTGNQLERFEEDGSLAGSFRLPPLAGAVLLKAPRAAAGDRDQPGEGSVPGRAVGVSAVTPTGERWSQRRRIWRMRCW
jgi:hypothetical protein